MKNGDLSEAGAGDLRAAALRSRAAIRADREYFELEDSLG